MTFSFLVPNISGNICAASTIQQKEDTTVAVSPFFCYLCCRGSLTIIINKCTQLELEHQTCLKHMEVLVVLELIAIKTIVSIAQHYLGELVERVVYA